MTIAEAGPRPRVRPVRTFLTAVLAAALAAPAAAQSQQPKTPAPPSPEAAPLQDEPEVYPAVKAFLEMVRTAGDQRLRGINGFTENVIAKIMARRRSGVGFKNLVEFEKETGIAHESLINALKPFQDQEDQRALRMERKPIPAPGAPADAAQDPRMRAKAPAQRGEAPAAPSASSAEGPIGSVRPHYYSKLPGFDDLDKADPAVRKEFLETVNRDTCTCGCEGETIAFCLVNDPGCPVIKARARKIYEDLLARTSAR